MKISTFFLKITFISIILTVSSVIFATEIPPAVLEKIQKGVVTISSRISFAAYKDTGNMSGTGFIASKRDGLVVTNAHMVTPASIGLYFITFFNGQETEAKLLYYDSWQDYAILKLDPKTIPSDALDIPFSKESPKLGQEVFIVGNNEAQDFSFHSGYLSNLYDVNGEMPQHTYIVNLNVAGGSSGSPLVNNKGEAIGLHYGGNRTFGMSLKGDYVTYALDAIKNGKTPVRKHIGVISEIYSLDKAVNHRNFPKELMEQYIKNHPEYRNKVLSVKYVLSNSRADGVLLPGDILWEVNGKAICSNLFLLDNIMNNSDNDKISLTIYRNGEKKDVEITLYNIETYKVKTLLDFAGSLIFETDDFSSAKSGAPLGSLAMVNVKKGSGLSAIPTYVRYGNDVSYRLVITHLDKHPITDLKSLLDVLPSVITKKFITIDFKNHQPYVEQFNNVLQSGHNFMTTDITLDALDTKPRIMRFDDKTGDWVVEEVKRK
jgi:S1-C subfamily serine protease